ncbi:hypothetical protein D3C79_808060 [compost metagenome]
MQVAEHPGQQLALRVGQGGPYLHIACAVFDLGVDRADAAGEGLLWIGGDTDQHPLAQAQLGDRLFGDEEIDVEAAQVLQGGDYCTAGQVVADIHLANADGAAERCADAFFRQGGFELINYRPAALVLGSEAVVFAAGNGLAADQLAAAIEVHLGEAKVSLSRAE